MTAPILELVIVAVSVGLLGISLALAARWRPIASAPAELRRKCIHFSLGLYCLSLPLLFAHVWQAWLACALALIVFALARGKLRRSLGRGLHAVSRASHGEVYFTLAVALLFTLHGGAPAALGVAAYVLPLAVLTISDAAAALIGERFGRLRFAVGGGSKSWEGVATFWASAWIIGYAALHLLTELSAAQIGALSIAVASVGAAVEATSTRGLDNLLLPTILYGLLWAALREGFDWALITSATLAAMATLVLLMASERRRAR